MSSEPGIVVASNSVAIPANIAKNAPIDDTHKKRYTSTRRTAALVQIVAKESQ